MNLSDLREESAGLRRLADANKRAAACLAILTNAYDGPETPNGSAIALACEALEGEPNALLYGQRAATSTTAHIVKLRRLIDEALHYLDASAPMDLIRAMQAAAGSVATVAGNPKPSTYVASGGPGRCVFYDGPNGAGGE